MQHSSAEMVDRARFPRFTVAFEFTAITTILGLAWAATRAMDPSAAVTDEAVSALWVMFAILAVMTTAVIMLLRSSRGTKLVSALFAFALLMGVGSIFAALAGTGASVLAMAIAACVYHANPPVWAYDAIFVFGIAGIAASMGPPLTPDVVLAFLAVLAAYDVLAVYGARHAAWLAKMLLRRRVFFAMIVPEARRLLRVRLNDVGSSGKGLILLGAGDLVLPALLVASVAARHGAEKAVPIAIGALLGHVGFTLIPMKEDGEPMPLLPPIAAGALLGYAFSFFLQ